MKFNSLFILSLFGISKFFSNPLETCIKDNTDCSGSNLIEEKVSNIYECISLCDRTEECKAIAYTYKNLKCYIKYEEPPYSNNNDVQCYYKSCWTKKSIDCKRSVIGNEYGGNISITETGIQCKPWSSHSNLYPNEESNYCRNPNSNIRGPFCQAEKNSKGYCNIPLCEDLILKIFGLFKSEERKRCATNQREIELPSWSGGGDSIFAFGKFAEYQMDIYNPQKIPFKLNFVLYDERNPPGAEIIGPDYLVFCKSDSRIQECPRFDTKSSSERKTLLIYECGCNMNTVVIAWIRFETLSKNANGIYLKEVHALI